MTFAITFTVTLVGALGVGLGIVLGAWRLVTRRNRRQQPRIIDLTTTTTDRSRRGPWVN